jgi:hypothetical protein
VSSSLSGELTNRVASQAGGAEHFAVAHGYVAPNVKTKDPFPSKVFFSWATFLSVYSARSDFGNKWPEDRWYF